MKKVLWVKIGWADRYQGDVVRGDFKHPAERRAEMFNFLPDEDGNYCGYTGYMSGSSPSSDDPEGWLAIFLARNPTGGGMHIVGWYEDAELIGSATRRDVAFPPLPGQDFPPDYSITAATAYLVPSEHRTERFSHSSIGSTKFSYLSGPGVERSATRLEVRKELLKRIKKLRAVAIANPSSGVPIAKVDPLFPLGSVEFRAKVEKAAVKAVRGKLRAAGFRVKSHEHLNRGYDLKATHRMTGEIQRVEVKGTAGMSRRFFISANEYKFRNKPEWRFAIVTDALGKADVDIMTLATFDEQFDLAPMVWVGKSKSEDLA
jgi:hypothetical protein